MRDYAKVSPNFWTGKTGRALKAAGPETLVVALYLMTCQHANMIGLYYLDPTYVAVDTGLGFEGASKGLASACEAGFCEFDGDTQMVWVKEMAAYQIGEQLEEKDNRCKGVQREYDSVPENPFLAAFYERYAQRFHMTNCRGAELKKQKPLRSPSKAPTKPGTGTGTGTGLNTGLPAGFTAFWSAWPKSNRKGGKPDCVKAWEKYGCESIWTDIVAHVEAMKKSQDWTKQAGEFIPAPLVYLNKQRWDGAESGVPISGGFELVGGV